MILVVDSQVLLTVELIPGTHLAASEVAAHRLSMAILTSSHLRFPLRHSALTTQRNRHDLLRMLTVAESNLQRYDDEYWRLKQ